MLVANSRLQVIEDNSSGDFFTPADKNIIYYNSFKKAHIENVFKSFSLKYVLKGTAYYKISSGLYKITADAVLIAPAQPGMVYFNEKEEVVVLCVSVNDTLIAEAYHLLKEKLSFDNLLDGYFRYPDFIEALYKNNDVTYLPILRSLCSIVSEKRKIPVISEEWFFTMSEKIVSNEIANIKSLSCLASHKLSTRKELLQRLHRAREYMDDNYLKVPSINTIAREAALSQFHFFRSFKEAYGVTPYQYMQARRLEHSKGLISQGIQTISATAFECGFSDINTFTKSFKKRFHEPPSCFFNKAPN